MVTLTKLNDKCIHGSVLVCFLIFMLTMFSAGQVTQPNHAQSEFCGDLPFDRTVPIPPATLKAILGTTEGKEGLEFAKAAERKNPAHLFRAAAIDLDQGRGKALIVGGIRPMSGADNDWFWIVLSPVKNPRIVLFAGGNCLEVTHRRTNGYRDIRAFWSSPSETIITNYRFNGRSYTIRTETRKPNR